MVIFLNAYFLNAMINKMIVMQRHSFDVLSYRDNYLEFLSGFLYSPAPEGTQKLLKVRKTESYIPIPSRDVSFYVLFFFFLLLILILSIPVSRPS